MGPSRSKIGQQEPEAHVMGSNKKFSGINRLQTVAEDKRRSHNKNCHTWAGSKDKKRNEKSEEDIPNGRAVTTCGAPRTKNSLLVLL